MAGQLTLEIEQGATFSHTILYQQRDGQPILGMDTAKMQIRVAHDTVSTLIATLSTEVDPGGTGAPWFEGGLALTPAEGKIEILLDPSDTSSLPAGNYFYDLIVTIGLDTRRVIEGSIAVDPAVTA